MNISRVFFCVSGLTIFWMSPLDSDQSNVVSAICRFTQFAYLLSWSRSVSLCRPHIMAVTYLFGFFKYFCLLLNPVLEMEIRMCLDNPCWIWVISRYFTEISIFSVQFRAQYCFAQFLLVVFPPPSIFSPPCQDFFILSSSSPSFIVAESITMWVLTPLPRQITRTNLINHRVTYMSWLVVLKRLLLIVTL